MFGDVGGFRYLSDCLNAARSSVGNVHLDEIDLASNSMRVVVVPSNNMGADEAHLRIIERPVFVNGSANMEVVICGNDRGYQHLADLVTRVAGDTDEGLDNHWHLDDAVDACLIPRSISLNIRSPLIEWSKENLGHWTGVVLERQPDYLPEDIHFMFESPEPYEEVCEKFARECLQLRNRPE